MVSAFNEQTRLAPHLLVFSTVNLQPHPLTLTLTRTMHPLQRRQLQPSPRVAILPVVVLGPAVPLAALVIVALLSEEVRSVLLRPLGAHLMHLLFVFGLTAGSFFTY
jgi:hypothetical protein